MIEEDRVEEIAKAEHMSAKGHDAEEQTGVICLVTGLIPGPQTLGFYYFQPGCPESRGRSCHGEGSKSHDVPVWLSCIKTLRTTHNCPAWCLYSCEVDVFRCKIPGTTCNDSAEPL